MVGTQEIKFTTLINKIVLTPLSFTLRCPGLCSPAPRGTAKAAMARACRVAMPMDIKCKVIPVHIGTIDTEESVTMVAFSEEVKFRFNNVPFRQIKSS